MFQLEYGGMVGGLYVISGNKYIYYNGETDTTNFVASTGSFLFIQNRTTEISWILFDRTFIYYGWTNETSGTSYRVTRTDILTNTNISTSITSSSTNSEVAGAKAVYDIIGNVESVLQTLNSGNGV